MLKKKTIIISICILVFFAVSFVILSGTPTVIKNVLTVKFENCEKVSEIEAAEITQPLLNKRISDYYEQYSIKQDLTNEQKNTIIDLDSFSLYRINVYIVNPTYRYLSINPEKIYTSSNCIFMPTENRYVDAFSSDNIEFLCYVPNGNADLTNNWLTEDGLELHISLDNLRHTKYVFEFKKMLK